MYKGSVNEIALVSVNTTKHNVYFDIKSQLSMKKNIFVMLRGAKKVSVCQLFLIGSYKCSQVPENFAK